MIKERSTYDELILYWESILRYNRKNLEASEIRLIEETIKGLKELKRITEELGKLKANQKN